MWVSTLVNKAQTAVVMQEFQLWTEGESGCKFRAMCTDPGSEFNSQTFMEYCAQDGVCRQLMTPYPPQQKGIVEHRNTLVVGTTCCMLKAKDLPGWFWGEVIITIVYILN
jgi:hypothetical protein